VGDRYVLEMMRANEASLGGEQSGHIIDLRLGTTGDGLMTAVSLFSILARRRTTLAEQASALHVAPQVLVNVRVGDKAVIERSENVRSAIQAVEKLLAGRGRALIRPSGTEPLVRVMLEGDDLSEIDRLAHELAEVIPREQGGSSRSIEI
jgi:phosphoglucosamine mutase